jgi:Uma2 family endonuclease
MVAFTKNHMTLDEYLDYDDGTDTRYELVDGVLVEMGAENDINVEIAALLVSVLLQFVPYYLIRRGTEIEVSRGLASSRYPDLMVLTAATRQAMERNQRSIVLRDQPAPALVVEVVSPGDETSDNYQRDYVEKRREYAARGIPEYWIIDPGRAVVLVLSLRDEAYQERQYSGNQAIVSPTFPELNLSADQVLTAGL